MATYQDKAGNVYTHDDGKLSFNAWIDENPARQEQWIMATTAHRIWQENNPTSHPSNANDDANAMFDEWMTYANARRTLPE